MFDAAEEQGVAPPKIEEPPVLFTWLEETYSAFWRLSKQRGTGFTGPEKIRTSDIVLFHAMFEPLDDPEDFYDMITAMDGRFMERVAEIQAKNKGSS